MSEKIEEAKQAAREFYEKQHKLMNALHELSPDEVIEFNPWFMTITAENFEKK